MTSQLTRPVLGTDLVAHALSRDLDRTVMVLSDGTTLSAGERLEEYWDNCRDSGYSAKRGDGQPCSCCRVFLTSDHDTLLLRGYPSCMRFAVHEVVLADGRRRHRPTLLERYIPANGRSNRRRSVSRSLVAIISLTRRASSIAPETPTA